MGVEIDVSTRHTQYFPGDVIEGSVHLNVTAKDAEGSSADELVLKLVGLARTRVMYDATLPAHNGTNIQAFNHRDVITENREILGYDIQLASFGGKAASGTHSFPFSVMLPPGLPPSMKEDGSSGGSCAIAYGLEARLHRPGILHFDAKGKAQLTVLSRRQGAVEPTPTVVGPSTRTVKKCCCFKSGSMSIGFEAEDSVVGQNEALGLTVVARNDSSTDVKAMHIELKQVSTWYARSHKDKTERVVASIVVAGDELGAVQRAAEKGNERGRSMSAMQDAARRDLQELLAAGAGTQYELFIPDTCLLTLQTDLIEVKHTLSVRLKTPHCISSPDVWTPVRVQPARGTEEEPGGASVFTPSSMQAKPYATASEVDANGNPKPVPVPQSAVGMEHDFGMPKPSAPGAY